MAPSIALALTLIFQASYEQGQVPDDLKRANVTPLYKKGDKSKAANYRPVSLTSTCCKIMEHIDHSHLMKFLESNKILSDHQHGFRKRRSCETQLLITVHDLAAGFDRRQQIDAILLSSARRLIKFYINGLLLSSIIMESETRPYHGSRPFLLTEVIFSRSSRVRGSAGHCPRPSPVPGLHQRPALKSLLVSTTVCRRLSAVQSDKKPSRRRVVADPPSSAPRVGTGLVDAV